VRTPAFWARRPPTALARLLSPIGAVYGWATARRMARPGARVAPAVVCIGNFVAGGAGKTPTAIAVADLLQAMGERVAFVSRGYRGALGAQAVKVDLSRHRASDVGDEPLLLAAIAPCYVARDRRLAARLAADDGASVLVLDDGLQSAALAHDFTLAVIDGGAGFGNGLCVPAGPLRAPVAAQLAMVSAVVLVDGISDVSAAALKAIGSTPVLSARIVPDPAIVSQLRNQNVFAFAGIGRPAKFFAMLEQIGARVVVARGYPDHHRYSGVELEGLFNEAARRGLMPVTTLKDFVRLKPAAAAKVLPAPITMAFEDVEAVRTLLREALARRRRSAP
jgi:tetraacyldisaccharide 4'-kinase